MGPLQFVAALANECAWVLAYRAFCSCERLLFPEIRMVNTHLKIEMDHAAHVDEQTPNRQNSGEGSEVTRPPGKGPQREIQSLER